MTDTPDWKPSEAMAARWIMDWAARFPDAGFGRLPVSVVAKSLSEAKPKIEAAERERMMEEVIKISEGYTDGDDIRNALRALKDSKP